MCFIKITTCYKRVKNVNVYSSLLQREPQYSSVETEPAHVNQRGTPTDLQFSLMFIAIKELMEIIIHSSSYDISKISSQLIAMYFMTRKFLLRYVGYNGFSQVLKASGMP